MRKLPYMASVHCLHCLWTRDGGASYPNIHSDKPADNSNHRRQAPAVELINLLDCRPNMEYPITETRGPVVAAEESSIDDLPMSRITPRGNKSKPNKTNLSNTRRLRKGSNHSRSNPKSDTIAAGDSLSQIAAAVQLIEDSGVQNLISASSLQASPSVVLAERSSSVILKDSPQGKEGKPEGGSLSHQINSGGSWSHDRSG